jgi:hypothetical protein
MSKGLWVSYVNSHHNPRTSSFMEKTGIYKRLAVPKITQLARDRDGRSNPNSSLPVSKPKH